MSKNSADKSSIISDSTCKAIFEKNLDAILVTKPDGRIVAVNEAACKLFCRTEEEILKVGRNGLLDITDARLPELLEERENTGKTSAELTFKKKDGSSFLGEFTSSVFRDISGELRTIMIIRDISDIKRLEKSVFESEANLKALINSVNDSLFLVDIEGKILLANNKLAERLGKRIDDLIDTNTFNLVSEDIAEHRRHFLDKAIFEGKSVTFIDKRLNRIIENRVFPVTDETGSVIRLAILGRDITEKSISEEDLVKSELKFRTLTSLLPAGIYMTDEAGKCTYVNDEWCMMSGFTPEEAYGDGWIKAIHPDDQQYIFNTWNKFVKTGKGWNWNYRFVDKKGRVRWVYGTARPIVGNDGKIISFLGANSDITELKIAEENLIQSEERYRLLSDQAGVGVGLYSPSGKILYFNKQAMRNLGGRLEDYLGKSLIEVFGKKDGSRYLKRVTEEIRLQKNLVFEDFFVSQAGRSWFSSSHFVLRDSSDEVIGVQVVSHDISERKQFEEQFKKTTKDLKSLTSHLVAIREEERNRIAHDLHDDLGQKLTALNMDISWLKSRIGVQSPVVENKFQQMLSMMNNCIESVQKISYGLRPSILDDLGLIPALEWLIKEFNKTYCISCSFTSSPVNLIVDNDVSLVVFRIVQEALTNVVRHSGADRVNVKVNLTDENLEVLIRDNGNGIEQQKIDSHKSFGLIGMRERVSIIGGDIHITGKKGKGTFISVTIPVRQ